MKSLDGETLRGEQVSFSALAYHDAMQRYDVKDIEHVVRQLERREEVDPEVANFFRDFAILQEMDHPDYDRGIAIGSLATRIELATGQITNQELKDQGIDTSAGRYEYELIFGDNLVIH